MKRLLVALLVLIAIGSLAANGWLYKKYSSSRPVLRVGNEVITLKEYRDNLDNKYGKALLSQMTLTKIVMQAAKREGVTPTEADVDTRIAEIQRRTPAVLEAAMKNPAQLQELRQGLMTDIALENLIIKDIPMSDAQLHEFYTKNAALFAVPTQAKTLIVVTQNSVDAATAAALMRQKGTTGAMLATQPRLGVVGINKQVNWNALSLKDRAALSKTVESTPVGGVSTVVLKDATVVVRVDEREKAGVTPFDKIKPTVSRMARLQKGPQRTLKMVQLYREAGVTIEMANYAPFFSDFDEAVRQLDNASPTGPAGAPKSSTNKVSQAK